MVSLPSAFMVNASVIGALAVIDWHSQVPGALQPLTRQGVPSTGQAKSFLARVPVTWMVTGQGVGKRSRRQPSACHAGSTSSQSAPLQVEPEFPYPSPSASTHQPTHVLLVQLFWQ